MKSRILIIFMTTAAVIVSCVGGPALPTREEIHTENDETNIAVDMANPTGDRQSDEDLPTTGEAYHTAIEELDIEQAIQMYEQIAAEGSPQARTEAQMTLAWFDYRVLDDPDGARARLSEIAAENPGWTQPLLLLSKIETLLGNYAAAQQAANRALDLSATPGELHDAQMLLTLATVEEAIAARINLSATTSGGSVEMEASAEPSTAELEGSHSILRAVVSAEPGRTADTATRG